MVRAKAEVTSQKLGGRLAVDEDGGGLRKKKRLIIKAVNQSN